VVLFAASACFDDNNPTRAANPPSGADEVLSTHQMEAASFGKAFLGGATTVFNTSNEAFEQPAPNLDAAAQALHDEGDEAFEEAFDEVTGVGPLFHNTSCEGCHLGDGRGRPPYAGEQMETMLFRLSIPGQDPFGGPKPAPGFGGQLQTRGITGVSGRRCAVHVHAGERSVCRRHDVLIASADAQLDQSVFADSDWLVVGTAYRSARVRARTA
jgi:CxxC motif-containing protein (DUF1111 family)